MRYPLVILLLANLLSGEDAPPPADGWAHKTKLGVFFQNTSSTKAETSRDPSIAGTSDSLSYKLSGDATVVWKQDKDRVEQQIEAYYGEIQTDEQDGWSENSDRLFYGATYERTLSKPQFLYGNSTVESAFTGPDPDNAAFDPTTAKLSTGYGHRYENLLPERDSLVWRTGVYVRKRWRNDAPDSEVETLHGPEWYVRYERQQSTDISYFVQYDGYAEFNDLEHVANSVEAGVSGKVANLFTVELKVRAYYEARPKDAAGSDEGYSEWSLRQEALLGLVWQTGTL